MIYLDYAAHTPADAQVLHTFLETEQRYIGNPNSVHPAGQAAQQEMARITARIAQSCHVQPDEIIYTSGASESNNLAIKGIAGLAKHHGKHIISTALEHSSVGGCLTALQAQGYEIDLVRINSNGQIDVEHLRELVRADTILLAICAVDGELGTVQPLSQILHICRAYPHCHVHIDATQAVGKITLDYSQFDTVSIAPHKFHGICGSGLLIKRQGLVIAPQIHGGTSTTLYRSGTPALALAAATETALHLALTHTQTRAHAIGMLHATLRQALVRYPAVRINSPEDAVPHILNLSVLGVSGTAFQHALGAHGVCVSVKSACSTAATPSKAVFAVSGDRKRALSSWRISLSHLTTPQEIDAFLCAFQLCYQELLP